MYYYRVKDATNRFKMMVTFIDEVLTDSTFPSQSQLLRCFLCLSEQPLGFR